MFKLISRRDYDSVLFALCVLAGVLYFVANDNRNADRAMSEAAKTHDVLSAADELLSSVKDAETGQRGFVLTGDSSYLDPYREAIATIPALAAHLQTLTLGQAPSSGTVRTIGALVHAKLVELGQTVRLRQSGAAVEAVEMVRLGKGQTLMVQLRQTIRILKEEQTQRYAAAVERALIHRRHTWWANGLGAVLFLWLLIAGARALTQARRREKEASQLQQLAIEAGHVGFWDWDIPSNRVTWSDQIYEFHGLQRGDFDGTVEGFAKLVHPDDAPRLNETLKKCLEEGNVFRVEFRALRPDGETRWLSAQARVIREGGKPARLLGATIDLTESKQTEESLRESQQALVRLNQDLERRVRERSHELLKTQEALHQSQKLEAVGRLAGGVAHDFNNLMTGVLGIAQDVADSLPENDSRRSDLMDVVKATQRANSLTRQLLAFSRQQISAPKIVNLNQIVQEMNNLLRRLIGEDIELTARLDPALKTIRIDPGQVEQILINLVVNARDAMPQGGRLTIQTSNANVTDEYVKRHIEARPGEYVVMSVSDTGTGMTDQIQAHIFEPFFTTKTKDKGSGLGLATVYGIVKQNAGDISVYSSPGAGATFKIFLPVAVSEQATDDAPLAPAALVKPGTETVLVVEDEEVVRRVVLKALLRRGYIVLTAADGKEALELVTSYGKPIDLLITDVILPGMNGRQIADMVQAISPQTRVLYMSGFTRDVIVDRGVLKPGIAFLEKSFTGDQLAEKVRQVLDDPSPVNAS